MSFLDYLDDHRGQYIDHRTTPPQRPGVHIDDDAPSEPASSGRGSARSRRRRTRGGPEGAKFRHIRPAFSPSPYSDPLPYEEPWERAER